MADQDVYFKIGLLDHPDSAARLKALADAVRGTMADIEVATRGAQQSLAGIGVAAAEASAKAYAGGASRFSMPAPVAFSAAGSHALPGTTTTTQTYESQLVRLAGVTPENVAGLGHPPASPAATNAPTSPLRGPSAPEPVQQKAKDDAKRYTASFSETIGQLAGLEGDDLKLLVGGDKERFSVLGKENGKAYRDSLREQLTSDLGLSGDMANELFGAQGGAGLGKQQAEHAAQQKQKSDDYKAESDRLMQSLTGNIEAWGRLDDAGQAASLSLGKNFRELAEKSEGFASGIGQVASGLAFLGAKNENIKTLINTLLTIKGVSDIGIGVVKSLSGVAQVISLVKERQQLGNKQTEIAVEQNRLARAAAADYVQLLQREGIELEKATQGNREHAQILARVAAEARGAAAAERDLANAASSPAVGGSGGARGGSGRRGRRMGRGRSMLSFGGSLLTGGLASSLFGPGIGSDVADMAIDEGVDRLATRGGLSRAARFGGQAARIAGPVVAAAGVGKGLYDLGSGIVNEGQFKFREGSMSQRLSAGASYYGGMADYYLGLDTIHGKAYGGQIEIDKKIAEATKQREDKAFQNQVSDSFQAIGMSGQYEKEDLRRSGIDSVSRIRRQRTTNLDSLGIDKARLQSDLITQQQLASLHGGDTTFAGKRQQEQSQFMQSQLGNQITTVTDIASAASSSGVPTEQEELAKQRVDLQKELKTVMADVAKYSEDIAANGESYDRATQRARDLTEQLKGVEQENLRLVQDQKAARIAANQAAIDGATRRMELFRQERQAAEQTLKSGAERFASMSRADQQAAIRAQEMANSGNAESLTDRQRGLLRNIGTQSAVAAAEKADAAEAKQRGFFTAFGQEEQQRVAKATELERQARVEITNKSEVKVELTAEMDRIADVVAQRVQRITKELEGTINQRIDARLLKQRSELMTQANQEAQKRRNERNT